ncbi:MAG: hypothetical protein WC881_11065 [Elusimicrobiota bacterium]|jgi:hypothetical protein
MSAFCAALWLFLAPARAQEAQGWQWHETLTPHFAIAHEMPWPPSGLVMDLEKMHNRLRMDLGMFSPWMAKERIKLYLYRDAKSYLSGEFHPPIWSNGLALFEKKAVAVPDNPDRKALLRVVGHETSHLLFNGFWREAGKEPPAWINEGLAMLEESDYSDHPERSLWYQAMVAAQPKAFLPTEQFFALSPAKDLRDQDTIGEWYVQAYSLVHFLYRKHQRLQFKDFCERLRAGDTLDHSLWLAYRYKDRETLEKAWKRWLALPEHGKRAASAQIAAAAAAPPAKPKGSFAPSTITPMKDFKSLRD